MDIWYRVSQFSEQLITPAEVMKSTAKTVTFAPERNGRARRAAIVSTYEHYFRTWEEAYAYLLANAELRIQASRMNLEMANSYLGKVLDLKKPA